MHPGAWWSRYSRRACRSHSARAGALLRQSIWSSTQTTEVVTIAYHGIHRAVVLNIRCPKRAAKCPSSSTMVNNFYYGPTGTDRFCWCCQVTYRVVGLPRTSSPHLAARTGWPPWIRWELAGRDRVALWPESWWEQELPALRPASSRIWAMKKLYRDGYERGRCHCAAARVGLPLAGTRRDCR